MGYYGGPVLLVFLPSNLPTYSVKHFPNHNTVKFMFCIKAQILTLLKTNTFSIELHMPYYRSGTTTASRPKSYSAGNLDHGTKPPSGKAGLVENKVNYTTFTSRSHLTCHVFRCTC